MNTTLHYLKEARNLIAQGWTKATLARDAFSIPCDASNPNATCFCAVGAAHKVTKPNPDFYPFVIDALREQIPQSYECIPDWNDDPHRTQAEVLEVFDKAISALDSSPKEEQS